MSINLFTYMLALSLFLQLTMKQTGHSIYFVWSLCIASSRCYAAACGQTEWMGRGGMGRRDVSKAHTRFCTHTDYLKTKMFKHSVPICFYIV